MLKRRGMTRSLLLAAALAGPLALALPAAAQDLGRVVSPVLTIDRDRLFAGTLFGQRVNAETEVARAAMAEETRKIEIALAEEEKTLTAQRATMSPKAFRELADAFDAKVRALRIERDAAEENLRAQITAAQTAFFDQIGPTLGLLVRERGAVMIVDRRAILLTTADIDITAEAIARIDLLLGDGIEEAMEDGASGGAAATPAVDTIPAPE